ncbi:hypothetical protein GPX-Vietnam_137 [Goatpox virus]|uniref:Protein OPG181 n=2 Tax=Goatpox virus TaxID=186805 RepID=A0A1B2LPT6_9POXV|nr:hypothetical protein GTPV_gp130 [Goatpox virus Pellor]AGZ95452.1 hypothetical protein [Goatpox virus FZ]AOA33095.1 hypothetical protein GTPV_gp130 [Goatpox virus]AXA19896.1 hypothetical protein [Goatpox virus]QEJ78836.1 hypothetical protein GPX-India_137 [Goatpox virus]QEJ78986.1 hypothetical protein GPX-Vietnam_137 [Goatpox virus]
MDIILGNTFSNNDWDISEFFKNVFENNVFENPRNICSVFDSIIIGNKTKSKIIVADTPKIDLSISNTYKEKKKVDLIRVSRFCKAVALKSKKDYVYIPETKIPFAILTVSIIDDDLKHELSYCSLQNKQYDLSMNINSFAIVTKCNGLSIKGTNMLIVITFFEEKNYPHIPLIRTISSNDVFISRHSRLHKEIPNKDWFKFYVEFNHNYCTALTVIIDGSILYSRSDYKTHCIISKYQSKKDEINDDCCCCYNTPSVYILNKKEIIEYVSCNTIRGGIHISLKGVGDFSSSYIGKCPNVEHLKVVIGSTYDMLTKQDSISGKKMYCSYIYGIAHR